MGGNHHIGDVLVVLAALVVFVPLFQRLRGGPVLGYLAAGAAIGPAGLGLVGDVAGTRALAEFGVVFLLFSVGLELKLDRLRLIGPAIYGLALAQVLITGLAIAAVAHAAGLEPAPALVVGGGLALSSTALVLQILADHGRTATQFGRAVVAILLVQDLAVGPLLLFIQGLAGEMPPLGFALMETALKAAAVLAVIVAAARFLLRPLLRLVAEAGSEVFAGAVLLVVLGAGWLTEAAGLSMALGAFLAGLMVADTEFRHQVAADIQPFRGLLLGLFFMTVGMGVDLGFAAGRAGTVALVTIGMLGSKAALLTLLALLFRQPPRRAFGIGAILSQGSEFAFVLFALAGAEGVLPAGQVEVLTVAIALSMATTPLAAALGRPLAERLKAAQPRPLGNLAAETAGLAGHAIVVGFGQVGKAVARHLVGQQVPVLILDLNPRRVSESRALGLPVFYGNATRLDVLKEARPEEARALVIALPESEPAATVAELARRAFPDLPIIARVAEEEDVRRLKTAGADAVALDGLTTALELAERVMLTPERPTAPR